MGTGRVRTFEKNQTYWKRGLELRKQVVDSIKEAKRSYITDKLEKHKKDSEKYWKAIRLILPNQRSAGIEVIYDPDSKEIVGGMTAANVINNYFASIWEKLANQLPACSTEFWPAKSDTEFIWDYAISLHDVHFYLKEFCAYKLSGIPNFSHRFC